MDSEDMAFWMARQKEMYERHKKAAEERARWRR